MKNFPRIIILTAIFLAALGAAAAGQTPKASVWAVDFVKTRAGERENYLKFIELNWAQARAFMKEKGIVASYRFLSAPPAAAAAEKKDWDVLLITEYVSREGYEKREAVFEEYRRTNAATPVGGKTAKELSEIKFNRTFNEPIPAEAWEIMLKTQNADAETAAARLPLENYLKGHETGNAEFMRKAFYAEGKLIFIRDGKYTTRTFEEYIGGMKDGKPAPDEAQRKRWIESVEVTGNAAVGKIILDYPNVKFTDYMTMLKIDGEWKIVNKSFYAEPKPKK